MIANRRPQCDKCLLCNDARSPYMEPDIRQLAVDHCDVLFVGEAPGRQEEEQNIPFVGVSGQLLRAIIEEVGLDNYSIMFTNMVRCRPPENKTPTTRQVNCCMERVKEEIAAYSPKVVVLLGNTPLKLIGESGITGWRGAIIERDGITYFPTFHPAYIVRNENELATLVNDMDTVAEIINGNTTQHNVSDDYDITFVQTAEEADYMVACIAVVGTVAFDTESNKGVKPFSEGTFPIQISFACKETKQAWVVRLHENSFVDDAALEVLKNPNIGKIGHFTKYDCLVILAEYGFEPAPIVGDCMLQSYVMDPTPGRHGLKQLAGQHLGMYEYDQDLRHHYATKEGRKANPAKGGDMSLVPLEIIVPYSAMDAIATIELHNLFDQHSDMDDKLRVLYDQLLLPGSTALLHMEASGLSIDEYLASQYTDIYGMTQKELYADMIYSNVVMDYVEWRAQVKAKMLSSGKDTVPANRRMSTRVKKEIPFVFNPNSSDQMQDILFDPNVLRKCTIECKKKRIRPYYHSGMKLTPTRYTDKGMPSAAWKDIKVFKDTDPFLGQYRYFKLLGKMLSTYLRPCTRWVGRDGHARSSYNEIGTLTGRLSSSDPNFQNIPTPEKEPGTLLEKLPIRNIFVSSFWETDPVPGYANTQIQGTLLSADYSGMELRTMASLSNCQSMMEMFASGQDIHSIVTTYLFNIPLEEVTKPLRYRAKWVNWTLLYGGDTHTLVRMYGLSMEEAESLVEKYFALFPEILVYRRDTLEKVRHLGYAESPFGRRRYFPYINDSDKKKANAAAREAINMPIQSAASDVLLCALIVVDKWRIEQGLQSRLCNTVHDSITWDICPNDELDVVAYNTRRVMENLTTEYGPAAFPGLDFSWFICPLKADIEVGDHYGSLHEYEVER